MNKSYFLTGRCFAVLLLIALANFFVQPMCFALSSAPFVNRQEEATLPDGTEFTVETTEEISSKTVVEGDPLTFKVRDDVTIDGKVVIAKGAIAKGVVSNSEKSGRLGKGGKLGIRIESTTTVDGQKIRLRASKGGEGDDKTATTVALVVLFGPLGFLKKGSDAKIKSGTEIKVYTDEQVRVRTGSSKTGLPPINHVIIW
ncbi:MAG: hypothetical protein ACR2N3_12050 [Pyrinomonadaceae bacterium]